MKIKVLVLSLCASLLLISCSVAKNLISPPSAIETALALKEILNSSAFKAIKALNQADGQNDLIPPELDAVLGALNTLGYGEELSQVKTAVAEASGIVASEGEIIMKDAIKEVTFKDAAKIVVTGGDAATGVLKQAMYKTVTRRYSDRLDEELGKTEAKKYWPIASNAYNIFAKEKINDNLSDFLAKRAVDAVFLGMGAKEKEVRTDYKSIGKKVVTKVFDYYKDKKLNSKGQIINK